MSVAASLVSVIDRMLDAVFVNSAKVLGRVSAAAGVTPASIALI